VSWMDEWRAPIQEAIETALLDAHRTAWAEGGELGKFVGFIRDDDGAYMVEWEIVR